jgi:HK97 family phage major capsid protein/HK97 family phage prohead protease
MDRLEFKAALGVDEAGTIEGIAWPFGSADRVGDVITKGAFGGVRTPLPMLHAHNQAEPIGVWDAIEETDEGLAVKGRLLVAEVERAREVRALIREGAITGLSIGFVAKSATPRQGGGRTISALDLLEVSAVAIPCHPGARITHAKAAAAASTNREDDMDNQDVAAPDIAAIEKKLADRLDAIEARINRPAIVSGDDAEPGHDVKAFAAYARLGVERMDPADTKALVRSTDSAGGFLAPEEIGAELIKLLREASPLRAYANVGNISAGSVKYPRRIGSTAATWVSETGTRTGSQPAFEQVEITAHELATYVDVSVQLLEDNAYSLESELLADLAESFAIAEGQAFILGDGVGKPMGVLNAAGVPAIAGPNVAGFTGTALADLLIDAFHSLPQLHRNRGAWAMNAATLAVLRKTKNASGDYIALDGITPGAPTTILGRPVVEMVDMPDIAADATPIVFGDWQGYRIRDRVGFSLLRDPYTLANVGQVRFHARRRVGADVTHPDRLVKITVAAS